MFLIGFRREGCRGQVTSPVTAFDPAARRVATTEGRIYLLSERPGLNSDAFWLWRAFREKHCLSEERDVTDCIEALIWAAREPNLQEIGTSPTQPRQAGP